MLDLIVSIVTFNTPDEELEKAIMSFSSSKLTFEIHIVDNSPTPCSEKVALRLGAKYLHTGKNIGYGSGHNLILKKSLIQAKYHLVMNPDIYFSDPVPDVLFHFMEQNPEAGMVMPRVLYPNGETQHLCNLLPSPLDLFLRRFMPKRFSFSKRNHRYEMRFFGYDRIANIPYLSGCFMWLRNETVKRVGFFDERFFMYMEDVDYSRRFHEVSRTVFFPAAFVYHGFRKESYKNFFLLYHHILSAIKYFCKWGWFLDNKRQIVNLVAKNGTPKFSRITSI